LIATREESDFTLLELSDTPSSTYNPYYNGWDRTNTPGAGGVCIHHPKGDVKKISTHNLTPGNSECFNFTYNAGCGSTYYSNSNFWLIHPWLQTSNGWGVTEGGSSGSPLYNDNSHVIGQLFGAGTCNNQNCYDPSNDYSNYGKIFVSWNSGSSSNERLSEWLDPIGNNPEALDGRYGGSTPVNPCKYDNDTAIIEATITTDINYPAKCSYTIRNTIIDNNASVSVIHQWMTKIENNFEVKIGSSFQVNIE
jgi:hypothetical protein